MKKLIVLGLFSSGLLLASTPSMAADQSDARTRTMAANCAYCHGPEGKSRGAIPSIAGLDKGYFVQQMKDFAAGTRPATVMHQHAGGYTEEEFEKLAAWFAAIKQ